MGFMETLAPIVELSVVYVLLCATGRPPARAERTERERATGRYVGPPARKVRLSLLSPSCLLSLRAPKKNAGAFPEEALDVRAVPLKERP
jgi:hypothetical protein